MPAEVGEQPPGGSQVATAQGNIDGHPGCEVGPAVAADPPGGGRVIQLAGRIHRLGPYAGCVPPLGSGAGLSGTGRAGWVRR